MKTTDCTNLAKTAVLAASLSLAANLWAVTLGTAPSADRPADGRSGFQTVRFSDSTEAGLLVRAYRILEMGDHDYKGNRVKAMRAVEAAAKLLGVNLRGDGRGHEKQSLSDEQLREARGLIAQVLSSAEVKRQKRVTKHLNAAITHLNTALAVR